MICFHNSTNLNLMNEQIGKWVMLVGIVLVVVGGVYWLLGDKLTWIGRLPGDIRIERENFKFYFPITTIILFSILLNVIIRIVRQFL